MKIKLQPASGTELPAFSPLLPPAVVSQVLLLANPHKVRGSGSALSLNVAIMYCCEGQGQCCLQGDVWEGDTMGCAGGHFFHCNSFSGLNGQ